MMSKEAAKSCLASEIINYRILIAHFITKKFRISVMLNRLTEILLTQMKYSYSYRSK